ncbi:hypothetical protein [Halomarina ordinaria]|uniref:Uncharacterized protein n=1 Tax=Halomarina ordinaria TaxID=3033939 RepID=A0ABD5UBF2_9EURY|nr:hypothetical protein [Halomarina sp. PSRA2]
MPSKTRDTTVERTEDEGVRERLGDSLDAATGRRPGVSTSRQTDRVMRYGTLAVGSLVVALALSVLPFVGAIPLSGLLATLAWLGVVVFGVLAAYPLVKALAT